ncbi:unnamed protein product, partial [Medioppia subpectinata]
MDLDKYESLITTEVQVLKRKDFVSEFRPQRDVQLFVSDSCVLLDCREFNLQSIIDQMFSNFGLKGMSSYLCPTLVFCSTVENSIYNQLLIKCFPDGKNGGIDSD